MNAEKRVEAGGSCARCKRTTAFDGKTVGKSFSLDHIHEKRDCKVGQAHGKYTEGTDAEDNLQLLCNDCHKQKTELFSQKRKELKRSLTKEESLALNAYFLQTTIQIRNRTDAYEFLRKAESPYRNQGGSTQVLPISLRGTRPPQDADIADVQLGLQKGEV